MYGTRSVIATFTKARHLPLSYARADQASQSRFLEIHFNIIHPSTPRSSKWSLYFTFPHQNQVYVSPLHHTRYMSHSSRCSRFYNPQTTFGEQCRTLSSSLCSFLHSPVNLFPPRPLILFSAPNMYVHSDKRTFKK